jgi:serine/threonine-protein kinase
MAQFQMGSADDARRSFATAVQNYNWKPTSAGHTTVWVSHVVRREAEAMLLPNLPAFLKGEYKPTENQERLSFLGICESQGRYAAVAQLCADAFAADPKLAGSLTTDCMRRAAGEDSYADRIEALNTECRYVAARCAVLAASGVGTDSATLTETDRARLAAQAQDWLLADLAVWSQKPDVNEQPSQRLKHEMLTAWLTEPDLAALRDATAINGQSEADTTRSADLWNKVRAAARASQ